VEDSLSLLLETLARIEQTISIEAAEYVPAIADVFAIIDQARRQHADEGGGLRQDRARLNLLLDWWYGIRGSDLNLRQALAPEELVQMLDAYLREGSSPKGECPPGPNAEHAEPGGVSHAPKTEAEAKSAQEGVPAEALNADECGMPAWLKNARKDQEEGEVGFWRSCSGCYETEDGHPTQRYGYSDALGCSLGAGCSECGGLGAVWDNTDYQAMADFMAEDPPATHPTPAQEAPEPMADPDFDDCTDAFNGWIWQAYRFSEPATFTLHNMAVAFRAGAEWKDATTGQTELVRDLLKMWPDVRVLVDGFTVNSAWNNEWDAQVRQRMIDFGMKHLFPLVFPPKTEERKC
jgi:hypothetical protein